MRAIRWLPLASAADAFASAAAAFASAAASFARWAELAPACPPEGRLPQHAMALVVGGVGRVARGASSGEGREGRVLGAEPVTGS